MTETNNTLAPATATEIDRPWAVYIVLLVSCFITIEAAAFQAPAIPTIAHFFGISAGLSALIALVYYLGLVVFSPVFGRVADQYGRKRVLLAGLAMFSLSEFFAAAVPNFPLLILARFLQGLSVACILPVILSYIGYLFPQEKRGMPLGVMVFSMSLGATTGAVIGGLMIDYLGWRSVYWVSGILALLGLALVAWKVPETPRNQQPWRLDWPGMLLLLLSVGALLSVPTWISNFGFTSWQALLALVAGVGGFTVLWYTQQRSASPVLDIGILRQRNFLVPGLIYLLFLICYGGTIYSLAFFVNDRPGGSASQVGLVNMFAYGSSMLAGLISGKLVDWFAEKTVIIAIVVLMFCGLFLYTTIGLDTSIWVIGAIAMVLGLAQGMKGPAITKMALGSVPQEKMGSGSGLFSMMRDFGTPAGVSVGLALYGATLARRTEETLQERAASLGLEDAFVPALAEALATSGAVVTPELQLRLAALGVDYVDLVADSRLDGMAATLPQVGFMLYAVLGLAALLTLLLRRSSAPRA
jgi:multidrug resistance protein